MRNAKNIMTSKAITTFNPWLWSEETLPAYWSVCKFDLILPVHFLVAFSVLTTIAACCLPLHQCIAIAFQILLSQRFIVPSVIQCYLVHCWLNILSIAQPMMMREQHGVMFHMASHIWWKVILKVVSILPAIF